MSPSEVSPQGLCQVPRITICYHFRAIWRPAGIVNRFCKIFSTGNWGLNNNYLYRFNGRTLHQYLPWDASSSLRALDYPLHARHDESVLMSRAMKLPEQRAWYYETLLEGASVIAQTEGTPEPGQPNPRWLEREATRILDLIRPAAYADKVKPYSNQEFDDAAAFILTFAQTRAGFVQKEASRFAPGAAPVY